MEDEADARLLDSPTLAALRDAGRLDVGAHTYGDPAVWWWGEDVRLRIGRYCSIAVDVTFLLGGNHRVDWVTTYPFSELPGWPEAAGIEGHPASKGDIVIGNDVWIGNGATILSGVAVGHGAVVAARAMVTRDVEPYSVVGGNPAKLLRHRFPPHLTEGLLDLAWWDWPESRVRRQLPLLLSGDVEGFLVAQGVATSRPRLRDRLARALPGTQRLRRHA